MRPAVLAAPETAGGVRLAIEAMATRFELVLPPGRVDDAKLRTIGEEALAEIARLGVRLSAFAPVSDVSWINSYAGQRRVKVEPHLFALLQRCVELSDATEGAFDITVGPLMQAWNFVGGDGARPAAGALADARARVGARHLDLDRASSTIRFARPGMRIDLGAAGKGYAIDRAVAILRGHGVDAALLHGGTSSVHAVGGPIAGDGWRVAWNPAPGDGRVFTLCDGALAVSAVHGKSFRDEGAEYGHVIDPRSGTPTRAARSAVVTGPASLESDALSTALLVLGPAWLPTLRARFPGYEGHAV